MDDRLFGIYIDSDVGYGVFSKTILPEKTILGLYGSKVVPKDEYSEYIWNYPKKYSKNDE